MNEETQTKQKKDDPIAIAVLEQLAGGSSLTFKDMAICVFEARRRPKDRPNGWRKFMTAVKQQVIYLARQGRVDIMRKGKVADPRDFKGIVRVRLAQKLD